MGTQLHKKAETESRRVLLVAPHPFFEDRGTPIAVRQVIEALCKNGYLVDVLTFPVGRELEIPGARFWRTRNALGFRHVPIGLSIKKLVLDVELILLLRRRLREEHRYMCVHAVEEAAFPAVWFGRQHGLPVIYDMQSSLPDQLGKHRVFRLPPLLGWLRKCEQWLLRRADLVMSSTGLREQVFGSAPDAHVEEWVFSAQRGVPEESEVALVRAGLNVSPRARLVVYTGTLEAYQGIANLIAAIPLVTAAVPDAVFVLVGGERERQQEIMARACRLGLNDSLRVVPQQPRERVPAYLQLADVLVSPRAFGANLPLKIFDYLAAGRPIVATDLPAHRAVLNEQRAVLVPPDPKAIADGISGLLLDPARAARLSAAAKDYARAHLSSDAFEVRINQLYDQVFNRVRDA